jgi:hypothetical protein
MSSRHGPGDGRGESPRDGGSGERRGPAARRFVGLAIAAAVLVVLVVWIVLYLTGQETTDDETGSAQTAVVLSVSQPSTPTSP